MLFWTSWREILDFKLLQLLVRALSLNRKVINQQIKKLRSASVMRFFPNSECPAGVARMRSSVNNAVATTSGSFVGVVRTAKSTAPELSLSRSDAVVAS